MSASNAAGIGRHSIFGRLLRFRRGPWEAMASIVIICGIAMLGQPLSLALYTYSFAAILAGAALFLVVQRFPD
jgi:hypothetical protein